MPSLLQLSTRTTFAAPSAAPMKPAAPGTSVSRSGHEHQGPHRRHDLRPASAHDCPGVIDCEAIDPWTAALQERGWLPDAPVIEPHPDGSGRAVGRWRLTAKGRAEWAQMEGAT
jgi:hypothetical protein